MLCLSILKQWLAYPKERFVSINVPETRLKRMSLVVPLVFINFSQIFHKNNFFSFVYNFYDE